MAQDEARPTRARRKKEQAEEAPAKRARRTRKAEAASPAPEIVAFHAYLMWERGEPGDATEHWLRAERELAAA